MMSCFHHKAPVGQLLTYSVLSQLQQCRTTYSLHGLSCSKHFRRKTSINKNTCVIYPRYVSPVCVQTKHFSSLCKTVTAIKDASVMNSWTCTDVWDKRVCQKQLNRCLNTQQIIEKSPVWFQPYLRLIRFDKPIGKERSVYS